MKSVKKIGIIGGVGPQSTNFIYERIIYYSQIKYNARNNSDYPQLLIASVPVPDFISNKDNIEIAKEMLEATAKSLSEAGVDRLCIGSNTVHILLNELSQQTEVLFLSMIELVGKKCVEMGLKKVGILGTPVLVKSNLYSNELNKNNISVILPSDDDLKVVENIIRHVIAGSTDAEIKKEYIAVLNKLFSQGAEAVILGCTELPLAVNYEALGDRTINTDAVLAEGIVDYFYS